MRTILRPIMILAGRLLSDPMGIGGEGVLPFFDPKIVEVLAFVIHKDRSRDSQSP